jgi:hypothetical protein
MPYSNGMPSLPGGRLRSTRRTPARRRQERTRWYLLAGEYLRVDRRFGHSLDRALCRVWLRRTCAHGAHFYASIGVAGLLRP